MNLETLVAERDIARAIASIARAMDERDWDALKQLVAANVCADFGAGEMSGDDAVIAHIRSFLDSCGPTQHLIGNVIVDVNGATARSRAYVSDLHLARGKGDDSSFRTLGEYHDEWIRIEDRWRLLRRWKDNRATVGSMAVFEQRPD